jgi:hypothetical protein
MKIIQNFFFISCVLLCSCTHTSLDNKETAMSEQLYTIPENCDFMSVMNGSQENECSPKLLDEFFSPYSGIIINLPKTIVWPKEASLDDYPPGPYGTTDGPLRLMLAGLIRVKYLTLNLKGDTGKEVLVVAVNQKTAKTYSGKMPSPDFLPPPFDAQTTEPEMTEADRNALLTSHFNLDLVHDLGLPITDATYTVYATLGEYKSNTLTIKTSVK